DFLLLHRVYRRSGRPSLDDIRIDDGRITWSYAHTHNARAVITVEVGDGSGWHAAAVAGPCTSSVPLTLERIAPAARAHRLRLVAADGWNAHSAPQDALELPQQPDVRALARHAGERTFWADIDAGLDDDAVEWQYGAD